MYVVQCPKSTQVLKDQNLNVKTVQQDKSLDYKQCNNLSEIKMNFLIVFAIRSSK